MIFSGKGLGIALIGIPARKAVAASRGCGGVFNGASRLSYGILRLSVVIRIKLNIGFVFEKLNREIVDINIAVAVCGKREIKRVRLFLFNRGGKADHRRLPPLANVRRGNGKEVYSRSVRIIIVSSRKCKVDIGIADGAVYLIAQSCRINPAVIEYQRGISANENIAEIIKLSH